MSQPPTVSLICWYVQGALQLGFPTLSQLEKTPELEQYTMIVQQKFEDPFQKLVIFPTREMRTPNLFDKMMYRMYTISKKGINACCSECSS